MTRIAHLSTWNHRVDQENPSRYVDVTTTCGMLVPWRLTEPGDAQEVDCPRCIYINQLYVWDQENGDEYGTNI